MVLTSYLKQNFYWRYSCIFTPEVVFYEIIRKLLLTKEILNQPIFFFFNLKPNSTLAVVIQKVSKFSHPVLPLINKVYLWVGSLLIWYQNGLESDETVDVTSKKVGFISKVHYFDFLLSCLYTLNPLSLSFKWVVTLVPTTYRNMENRQSAKLPHGKGKVIREETIYFYF